VRCLSLFDRPCAPQKSVTHGQGDATPTVTFPTAQRRRLLTSYILRESYCGHARLCVCLSAAVRPHYCTDPDVTWGRHRGCPLVVHCWADLQSVHERLRCYGNITRTLVYAGCARVADQ